PSGQVSTHNKTSMEDIKNDAAMWGMRQLRPNSVSFSTATAHNIDKKDNTSALSSWASYMEAYIQRVFVIAGKSSNIQVINKVCSLEKDFSTVQLENLKEYLQSAEQGIISKDTIFDTMKKAGGIETQRTYQEEQEVIEQEKIREAQSENSSFGDE
ncbi:MAG: hypothetical protein KAJ10_15965, partial [Thermodesulfovibrionia bacterium]|nr:hypothetical protein [Thermodesulfovibrionia bacterium]